MVAPLIGAYVAVNGDRLIENGLASLNGKGANDSDSKLALVGGILYLLLTTNFFNYIQLGWSVLFVRVFLVWFRISCDYIDYDTFRRTIFGRVNQVISRNTIPSPKRKTSRAGKKSPGR